jgi:hypothetical protein
MQRRRRTARASASRHEQRSSSRSQADREVHDRQARVAMVMPPANRDLRLESVSRTDRNRLRKTTTLPCLLGCQPAQGALWADSIEPVFEVVHPPLDAPVRQARQDKAPPDAKGPECSLDLAIQIAMESTRLSTVADDSRAMEPSVIIGRPGWQRMALPLSRSS